MGVALNSWWPESRFAFQAKIIRRLSQINYSMSPLPWLPRSTEPTNLCRPLGLPVGRGARLSPLIACHFWRPQVYAPERDEHVKSTAAVAAAAAALGPAASYLCTPEAHGNASRGLWPL